MAQWSLFRSVLPSFPCAGFVVLTLSLLGAGCKEGCVESVTPPDPQPAPGSITTLEKVHPRFVQRYREEKIKDPYAKPPRGVGWWPRLAVAPGGTVHLAYCDADEGDLKYAIKPNGSSWEITTAQAEGAVGKYIDLALDDNHRPHVVFYDQSRNYLMYGALIDQQWHFERIVWGLEIGSGNKLIFDARGLPHIFYYSSSGRLLHSVRQRSLTEDVGHDDAQPIGPSAWTTETVRQAGGSFSVRLDATFGPDNLLYLSYVNWDLINSVFYLGRKEGGSWHHQLVDDFEAPGWRSAIFFDDQGLVLIYNNSRNESLYLARPDPEGGWNKTRINTNINNLAAALSPSGKLFIACEYTYLGGLADGSVRYLERQGQEDQWNVFDVDKGRPTGHYLDMALLPNGRPIIAYFDGTIRGLKIYSEANSDTGP